MLENNKLSFSIRAGTDVSNYSNFLAGLSDYITTQRHGFHLPTTAAGNIVLGLQAALPANPHSLPPSPLVDIALS